MNGHGDSGHQQWYGQQQSQYPYGQGYNPQQQQPTPPQWTPYHMTSQPRRRRGSSLIFSIVRHVSPVIPFILIIISAYVYIRDSVLDIHPKLPASDPYYLPLYLVIPISVVNIAWSFAIMVVQRRSAYRGRPISQKIHCSIEAILCMGAIVCFALMIAHIKSMRNDDSTDIWISLHYEGALTWLLGIQMVANGILAVKAALELKRERSRRDQQESYMVH